MTSACRPVRDRLPAYLQGELSTAQAGDIRTHLDACAACWDSWNRYRWRAAEAHPLLAELRTFLGNRFRPCFDSSKALAAEWDRAAPTTPAEIRAFYATTDSYLYNLAIWEASGNRPRYVPAALPVLQRVWPCTVLDFGCGLGSDTLALRDHGFTVIPYELPSPHADFAACRFQQRGQPTAVLDPAALAPADCLWIIDTLDHIPDLEATLGTALKTAEIVFTENLSISRAHGSQGFHIRRRFSTLRRTFAAYGLTPALHQECDQLMVWRR